ncbi:TIGR03643 family protein [Alkalicoccus luteus]|uniref:TIGR03643 family protein n=1 Tax=Alkalicoccus luteus TaxID=1237094 RepID=A0A969TXB3_9BACI|nr:TIGR03643 family protein [Alkalicoccus luteus]NJP38094.1 TIGR03643 family protein [Alkalicoccus luteus]
MSKRPDLSAEETDRVIEMAWEDRTPFEAIELQFGLKEKEVIKLMRREMKRSSFNMWRQRVSGRNTKHSRKRPSGVERFKAPDQKRISY